jgi:hypothetical protein
MNNGLNRFFFRETVRDSGISEGKVIRQRDDIGVYAHPEPRTASDRIGTIPEAGVRVGCLFALVRFLSQ